MKKNTKRILLFLCLSIMTIIANNMHAQIYEKVLKVDSTSWITYHRELEYTMKDLAYCKSINGTNYLCFAFGFDWSYPSLVGTLREDDGRLWVTYTDDPDNEVLIMDMNLEIGDKFVFDAYNNIIGTVVEVRHENGRKIIVFDRPSNNWYQEPIMFIEGVGRNIMSWEQYGDWDYSYQSCKYDSQELVYSTQNTHFRDCEIITDFTYEHLVGNQDIEVYPNPAKNEVVININNNEALFAIQVFNVNGVLVKSMTSIVEKTVIPINDLRSGTYIIKVTTHEQELYKEFLISK